MKILVEIKCSYRLRDITPEEACSKKLFYCSLENSTVILRHSHKYFCQVQGQMAICNRPWCDFVVYPSKGISCEQIKFRPSFWNKMLDKLTTFYDCCFAPELAHVGFANEEHAEKLKLQDLFMHTLCTFCPHTVSIIFSVQH